jgi:hypothetical protein
MKQAHWPDCLGRQPMEQPEVVEDLLAVRLQDFTSEAPRWAGGLFQYD